MSNTTHNKQIFKLILLSIFLMILVSIFTWFSFQVTPTKATVDSFLKENSCNPYATKTDSYSEYECAYYLRKNSAMKYGQITKARPSLSGINPFGYFSYDLTYDEYGCAVTDTCRNDEHYYVFVVTRDEGPLVYNPINGKYIGNYNDLMLEMGCKFEPTKREFFSSQNNKLGLTMDNLGCYMENGIKSMEKSLCSENKYNCADFKTEAEAQRMFERCGGISNDVHHLDLDFDGLACETLP